MGVLDGPRGGQNAHQNWTREIARVLNALKAAFETFVATMTPAGIAAMVMSYVYPIGCVYINVTGTNPSVELNFSSTWTKIASGQALVGQDTGQVEFDTLEETGGTKTETLD